VPGWAAGLANDVDLVIESTQAKAEAIVDSLDDGNPLRVWRGDVVRLEGNWRVRAGSDRSGKKSDGR
jgi:hypothetical protein